MDTWFTNHVNIFVSVGAVATVAQLVLLIVSVYFVWHQIQDAKEQLQKSVELTQASNAQKLVELTSPFNLQLIQNAEMAELWILGAGRYDQMGSVDRERYYNLLMWWLILHQNIFHQRKQGLMDKLTYVSWDNDLRYFVATKSIERHRGLWSSLFEPGFVGHLDELVANRENIRKAFGLSV